MKRPTVNGDHGALVTTPRASSMMQLLGSGAVSGSVALTRDEFAAVNKLYGFKPEKSNKKPAPPDPPKREDFDATWKYENALKDYEVALKLDAKWSDPRLFMQAGADRNAIRHAEADGLRLLAWLAHFVPSGEDPLKHLVQAAVDAGWDVDPADVEWAETEEEI